jgi:hypothetical protein
MRRAMPLLVVCTQSASSVVNDEDLTEESYTPEQLDHLFTSNTGL